MGRAFNWDPYLNGDFTGFLPLLDIRSDVFVHVLADKTLKSVVTGFIEWVVVLAVPCGIGTGDFGGESRGHVDSERM